MASKSPTASPTSSPPPLASQSGGDTSPFSALLERSSPQRAASVLPTVSEMRAISLSPQHPGTPPEIKEGISPLRDISSPRSAATTPTSLEQKPATTLCGTTLSSNTTTTPPPICIAAVTSFSATHSPPHSAAPSSSGSGSACSAAAPQQFCLRWNNYQSNLTSVFDQLLQNESFVDVTLACDGRSIKAHKMVLSACSPYFQTLFSDTPCQHPIVIMRDVSWGDLKAIVEFMYKGEINVSQEQIGPLLRIAEMLKVRGLADVNGGGGASTAEATSAVERDLHRDFSTSSKLQTSPKHRGGREQSNSPKQHLFERKSNVDEQDSIHDQHEDLLSFVEPEKKLRCMSRSGDWDFGGNSSNNNNTSSSNNNLELRLSPLTQQQQNQQQLVARNERKRRWPSTDTIFNPPASPLSGLIAAERAERERERERDRERERERSLMTPPIPTSSSSVHLQHHHPAGSSLAARLTPSLLDAAVGGGGAHIEMPSPAPTPTPATLLPPARTPSAVSLAVSPHLQHTQVSHHQQQQQQHHHQQQQQLSHHHHLHTHRTSPASASAPHQPPSSGPTLTPSPAGSSRGGEGESRFQHGHSQAAAMAAAAAAAAQMDLNMSMSHSSSAVGSHPPPPSSSAHHSSSSLVDDMEIKPGIAEMIREEERAKMLENSHAWMGASSSSIADSYQYQLQSMWQKCWNTNQNLMHHLRFRERGPLKSWRPETMAEAIFSVLKEGLSLSQAARKYDIPYPTFVLYANRVHNMLGPSIDGGPDLRPKGRGRPQRILLGIWPDEHIKGVIKTVVFRDSKDIKDDGIAAHMPPYGRHSDVVAAPSPLNYPGGGPGGTCPNGIPTPTGDQMSQEATAAAVAAVAHNIRQQMQMAAAAQQHQHVAEGAPPNIFNLPPHLQPHLAAAAAAAAAGSSGGGIVPLPKASISPALSSTSQPGALLSARHAASPCGSMPPSMAAQVAALHMASGPGPGPPQHHAMLSQQQQHQLQQLHLQQQHALHQQQQQMQQQQHSSAHTLIGYGASSMSHPSVAATSAATSAHHHHQQQQQQQQHHHRQQLQQQSHASAHSSSASGSNTKPPSSSAASPLSHERRPHSETPRLHSPLLTELGLELGYKSTSSRVGGVFSPTRLFSDDLAELVGAAVHSSSSAGAATTTATVTSSSSAPAATTSSSTGGGISGSSATPGDSISSSSGIKIEPITTSSE